MQIWKKKKTIKRSRTPRYLLEMELLISKIQNLKVVTNGEKVLVIVATNLFLRGRKYLRKFQRDNRNFNLLLDFDILRFSSMKRYFI